MNKIQLHKGKNRMKKMILISIVISFMLHTSIWPMNEESPLLTGIQMDFESKDHDLNAIGLDGASETEDFRARLIDPDEEEGGRCVCVTTKNCILYDMPCVRPLHIPEDEWECKGTCCNKRIKYMADTCGCAFACGCCVFLGLIFWYLSCSMSPES